jgi:hypothetical protein
VAVGDLLKNLAGVAVGLLFALTSAYAIKGGPEYPAGTNVVGTYAGVLTPTASPCASPTPPPMCTPAVASCAANSIGVFSIGVPSSGLATGTFVMFAQGRVFNGTVRGVADPDKATLKGVLSARYDFTVSRTTPCPEPVGTCTPSASRENVTATANGNLKTRITTSPTVTGGAATRLKGNATLDVSNGTVESGTLEQHVDCEMYLKVTGFKQTSTAPTTSGSP